jgi:hypothetical protein
MPKKKKSKKKRKVSAYAKCIGAELKGKMAGKTKTERTQMFKAATQTCKKKTTKKKED